MASLYMALIILTLSSSFTVFFSLLCFTSEVQQIYHLTVLVLLDNLSAFGCLSLLRSLYFFQLAFVFLEHKQQNYIQRRFHKYNGINSFLSLLEKGFMGIALATFTVRSH